VFPGASGGCVDDKLEVPVECDGKAWELRE
jgi:hypothetical protein